MKHALPLILAAIAVLSALTQANGQERKHRNKHKLTEIPELQRVVEKYNADGSIVIADNTRVSNDDILRYLDVSEEMTFDLQNKRQSQFKGTSIYVAIK